MRNYEDLEVWQKAHALTAFLQTLRQKQSTPNSAPLLAKSEERRAKSDIAKSGATQ